MSLGTMVLQSQRFQAPSVPTIIVDVSLPLDTSYPTGGYAAIEAAIIALLMQKVNVVDVLTACDAGSGLILAWDAAAKKLKLFTSNGASPNKLLEVPNATDLSAITLRFRALCE